MSKPVKQKFKGGNNIAMKLPRHLFEQTVAFYRDMLGLPIVKQTEESVAVEFGTQILWLDRVNRMSRPEIWLEIVTEDVQAAADYFNNEGVERRDEVERLPEGFNGFWIANPADVIHLVARQTESE